MNLNLNLHPKQGIVFQSDATEICYGGAAGGGKSHLLRVQSTVPSLEIPCLNTFLFRRLSDDLKVNHLVGSGGYLEMLEPLMQSGHVKYNKSESVFCFWNGARIFLRHCQYEHDVQKYQGAEIHQLLIDELTHFTEYQYRYLRARCRLGGLKLPEKYRGKFPRVIAATNPGNVGHAFVKRLWITNKIPLKIYQQPAEEGGMKRQFVPAVLNDNPTLVENDPFYLQKLEGLGSPALVKAMRDGNWDIVAGGALDDVWEAAVHILPRFKIPPTWRIDRSLDWGSDKPFSVGWWALADGTEAIFPDGRKFCPPKNTLVRFFEYYGTPEIGTNKGVKKSSTEVARKIKEYEAQMVKSGLVTGEIHAGVADNAIGKVDDAASDSTKKKMEAEGVYWLPSDKSSGSRQIGLQLLRDRLAAAKTKESPAIYFTENCHAAIATLPILPRDRSNTEDVDSDAEDHAYDEIRYRCLALKPATINPANFKFTRPF